MTSTFKELNDDCKARVRLYTEKLVYTEDVFMRFFVEGLKIFQRETQLDESSAVLTRTIPANFQLPSDCFWVKGCKDVNGVSILMNSAEQFERSRQKSRDGEIVHLDYDRVIQYSQRDYTQRRIFTVIDRELIVFPDKGDTTLTLWYIPFVESFSRASTQWAAWFVDDASFLTEFESTSLTEVFVPYEGALVQYVVAQLLKTESNPNYALAEKTFWEEIEMAKKNKQQLFRRGYADNVQSPWR